MGEEGVRHVMKSLLAEFDITMAVGGFTKIADMNRSVLESYPRSYGLLAEKSKL